ncbi:MAG: AAA family ATPase [Bacillota bacterium]|jgi:cytidylate kinase
MTHKILTIGRQYGSGGLEVGYAVADRLGIECYHRRLIQMAAESGDIDIHTLAAADEKRIKEQPYMDESESGAIEKINDRLFELQSDVIRDLAAQESCIIVGRCANYVLKDVPGVYSVFIRADMEDRLDRVISMSYMSEKQALKTIKKVDKERNEYYRTYTHKSWGEQDGYDIILNFSSLGKEECTDILYDLMK